MPRPAVIDPEEALSLYTGQHPQHPGEVWSYARIAREWYGDRGGVKVSKQAVGQAVRGLLRGGDEVPATAPLLPWSIGPQHKQSYVHNSLIFVAKQARGVELTPSQVRQAATFTAWLLRAQMVVFYDRSDSRGFVLRPRRPDDVDARDKTIRPPLMVLR